MNFHFFRVVPLSAFLPVFLQVPGSYTMDRHEETTSISKHKRNLPENGRLRDWEVEPGRNGDQGKGSFSFT